MRGQGVRGGSNDKKIFLPKIAQSDVLGTCEIWGASEKPFFGNLKSKPRGGPAPPLAGRPLWLRRNVNDTTTIIQVIKSARVMKKGVGHLIPFMEEEKDGQSSGEEVSNRLE